MNIKQKAQILSVKELGRDRLQVKVAGLSSNAIGMEIKGRFYLIIKFMSRNRLIVRAADEPISSKEAQSV